MNVKDVMSSEVASVNCGDSLQSAARKMQEINVGSLPVKDGERLAGVVTDRDIVLRAVAQGHDPNQPVDGAMTQQLITIAPDASVEEAAQLMAGNQIRRLYVTDGDKLAGVVSLGDLAVEAKQQEAGAALKEISKA